MNDFLDETSNLPLLAVVTMMDACDIGIHSNSTKRPFTMDYQVILTAPFKSKAGWIELVHPPKGNAILLMFFLLTPFCLGSSR